jgi:hypothetical protein
MSASWLEASAEAAYNSAKKKNEYFWRVERELEEFRRKIAKQLPGRSNKITSLILAAFVICVS